MNDVTRILAAIEHGDPQAAEQLLPLVYDELRRLAARRLAQEKPGQTLQATALVHEAYLRLVGGGREPAMERPRPLLRRRGRGDAPDPDRTGPATRAGSSAAAASSGSTSTRSTIGYESDELDLLALDEALTRLAAEEPDCARLVKLRFFAGLTHGGGGRGPRRDAADRRPLLGLCPRLAAPGHGGRATDGRAEEKSAVGLSHLGPERCIHLRSTEDRELIPCTDRPPSLEPVGHLQ